MTPILSRMKIAVVGAAVLAASFGLGSWSGAALPDIVVAQAKPGGEGEIPVYNPPKKFTPRARVGGTLRGTDGKDPEILALAPDHVGLTVKQKPVLNWFLSKQTVYPLRFTLVDTRVVKPIFEGPLPTPRQEGFQSLDLNDFGLALEPEVQYRWYISAIRNPESPSQDIVAGGVIERCEFSSCVTVTPVVLTCDRQSVTTNMMAGFWYDAMACLCDLIKDKPKDASLRRMRAGLLKQVGLNSLAEWDLKNGPPIQ